MVALSIPAVTGFYRSSSSRLKAEVSTVISTTERVKIQVCGYKCKVYCDLGKRQT